VLVKWDGYEARIDQGIAPLIKELWKAGIFTFNSCEENRPGIIWIKFASVPEAEEFMNIVARYEEDIDSLYNRIRQGWSRADGFIPGAWEYHALPEDISVRQRFLDDDTMEESCDGPSNFLFSMSIRFPKSDYPILLERMRAFNVAVDVLAKDSVA
jgi:hypothetical protein